MLIIIEHQAEDRCHRVGQTREVKVIRFTTEDTIEEGIYNIAQEKLKLEQDVTGENDKDTKTKKKDVARLLKVRNYSNILILVHDCYFVGGSWG